MNVAVYTSISVLATAVCLGTGYSTHGDITETFKNMGKSRFHVLVIVNMAYNILFLFGKLVQKVFFGNLRDAEIQNLSDRLLTYVLFKIVFVGAVMEPDVRELLIWTSWFSILGFLKIFTLLARDRFEYLNTFSPHTHPTIHVRMLTLLVLILFSDLAWFALCVKLFFEAGISVLLLLNFECFTIYLDTVQTLIKYAIHLLDLSRVDGVWEQRGQYIYYTEFATDSLVLAGTLGHYMHILYLHGLSVTLLDAVLFMHMRIVFNNLRVKIIAYRNYRQLAENMNHRYPSVSSEDLQQYNDDCAICREVMVTAKKLPCGHIFHHSCLRSWLEQHHSCPTCRYSLIDSQPQPQPQQQPPVQPAAPQFPAHPHPQFQPQFPQHPFLPNAQPMGPQPQIPGQPNAGPMNHPLLRFSSDRLFGWLPTFSVEVVRRQGLHPHHPAWGIPVPPEMIRAVQEIFPTMPANVIAQDLAITRSVEQTTENILEGRVVIPPVTVNNANPQPPPQPNTNLQAPIPNNDNNASRSDSSSVSNNTSSNSRSSSSSANNNNDASSSINNSNPSNDSSNANEATSAPGIMSKYSDSFASNAQDRKQSLQTRKQAMLEAARKQFLEAHTRKDPPNPTPKSAPEPQLQHPQSQQFQQPSQSPLQSPRPSQPQVQAQPQQLPQSYQQPSPQLNYQSSSSLSNYQSSPQSSSNTQSEEPRPSAHNEPSSPPPQTAESLEQRRRILLEAAQRRHSTNPNPPAENPQK